MLSVSKLSPGQEAYYERSVAAGVDDYYAGRGESPGIWAGRGAQELELEGVVAEGQLAKLVRGLHPLTDAQLRRRPPARTITSSGSTRRRASGGSRRRGSPRSPASPATPTRASRSGCTAT